MKKFIIISFLIVILSGCSNTTSTHIIEKDLSKEDIIEISYPDIQIKLKEKETFILYIGRPDCKDCQEFEPYLKQYLNKHEGTYLYYLNVKEAKDLASTSSLNKEKYNKMVKTLDYSWTPCLKIYKQGKEIDEYTFLDEKYYSLKSSKQKEVKQEYIKELTTWLNKYYQE